VERIVKSLVFRRRDTDAPVLLLVSGRNRVDVAHVSGQIGAALVRADADYVRARTGFSIGGVAPLGARERLATYMDADLFAFDEVWAAAGTPHAVFSVPPRALAAATRATIITVAADSGAPDHPR
jgi:prolyl-tRNA editing enzyme YbaK/EbsC (Cys-tRNA(Pro) deacylase)